MSGRYAVHVLSDEEVRRFKNIQKKPAVEEEIKISKHNFQPLKVDTAFEILNGLPDMKRSTLLRLCGLMWHQSNEIRQIFGTCEECYQWKGHPYFIRERPEGLHPLLLFDPEHGQLTSNEFFFHTHPTDFDQHATVFVDKCITKGIFRWTVKVTFGNGWPYFYLGVVSARTFQKKIVGSKYPSYTSTIHNGLNGCCFAFPCSESSFPKTCLKGVARYNRDINLPKTFVDPGSLVSVEVNADSKILSFFINEKKIPASVSDLFAPLYLAMSAQSNPSFVSVSFLRLNRPTPSSVKCTVYAFGD